MADETGEIAQLHRPRRTSCAEKNSRKNKIRREWGVSHQPVNHGRWFSGKFKALGYGTAPHPG
jgi:hypothetical protein